MVIRAFRFRSLPPVLLALAGFALAGSFATASHSQESAIYTISNNDGYGIADCMSSGSSCGRVMADSWCQAHGHKRALSYGLDADVTGAIKAADRPVRLASGDVVIRCGD